jgi:hypothetical protein
LSRRQGLLTRVENDIFRAKTDTRLCPLNCRIVWPDRAGFAGGFAQGMRMNDFEVLVLDGTNPTGVAMTRDILEAARLFAARTGQAAPTATFHSPAGGNVRLQGGLSIATRRLPTSPALRAPVLLIPGIWVENAEQLR